MLPARQRLEAVINVQYETVKALREWRLVEDLESQEERDKLSMALLNNAFYLTYSAAHLSTISMDETKEFRHIQNSIQRMVVYLTDRKYDE